LSGVEGQGMEVSRRLMSYADRQEVRYIHILGKKKGEPGKTDDGAEGDPLKNQKRNGEGFSFGPVLYCGNFTEVMQDPVQKENRRTGAAELRSVDGTRITLENLE